MATCGVILCAGLGERLAPVTASIPKCLAPILNIPIARWNYNSLRSVGVMDIRLNAYAHADAVVYWASTLPSPVSVIQESRLSGPLGGLLAVAASQDFDETYLVLSGDTYTEANLGAFLAAHIRSGAPMTVLAKHVPDPQRFGRLSLSSDGFVTDVREKVAAGSNLVSCGAYVVSGQVLESLCREAHPAGFDFGRHLMPMLAAARTPAYAHVITDDWSDIGTLASLIETNQRLLASSNIGEVAQVCPERESETVWCQGHRHSALVDLEVEGRLLIGENVKLGRGIVCRGGVILGDSSVVAGGVRLTGLIAARGQLIRGTEEPLSGFIS
jgi:NDP-sugar pyrophosphorylase family protein